MSDAGTMASAPPRKAPELLVLQRDDLSSALAAGWRDFKAAPKFGLFFGAIYALGGWALVTLASISGFHYFVFPLATGFALIAPFAAAGLYEVSRRLEVGLPLSWGAIFAAIRQGGVRDLGWMALVTGFALIIWMDLAVFIYLMFYGLNLPKAGEFAIAILTTPRGMLFFAAGNAAGAVIAFFVFSITVVACPILLDRDIDFVTAMLTSIRAVKKNPRQMLAWAFLIALFLGFSVLTGFLGLLLSLPILGHASWHLYKRAVAPEV